MSVPSAIVRKEMPELDTLRGVAVLMVVFFHGFGFLIGPYNLSQFHGFAKYFVAMTWLGWMGVNLFFVLSGFLITGILLDTRDSSGFYSRFYFRRALRILPVYYLVLLALPLLSVIPHFPRHVGWPFVGLSFVYCANLVYLFGIPLQYGPLWSLAVEEHFYLVWPTVVKAFSRRVLIAIAILIILLSPVIRGYAREMPGVTWQNLDGLAMGALLAIGARVGARRTLRNSAVACLGGSILASLVGLPFHVYQSSTWVGNAFKTTIVDLFFLGVLMFFLLIGTSQFAYLVRIRWLKFFGFISYGLYLVHMLSFDAYDAWFGPVQLTFPRLALRFVAALVVSTLFCWMMRTTYEEFFLKMKDRLQRKTKVPLAEPLVSA